MRPPLLLAPLAAMLLIAPRAEATDSAAESCAAASDQAQVLRDDGRLRQARVHFVQCASAACPAIIRKDCAAWLADVEARIPTVVFGVRDADGNDVSDVRVTVGGEPLVSRLDGRSVQLDAGEWIVRFERANGEEVSERITVREGERGRPIFVTLPRRGGANEAHFTPTAPEPGPKGRRVPLATWIFGGVAILGFAGFGYFWLSAVGDAEDLRTSCEPRCTERDLAGPRTKAVVADIALGVGVASTLAAACFYFVHPTEPNRAAVGVTPIQGGVALTARGAF